MSDDLDPHLALSNAILLDRTDVVGILIRKYGVQIGGECLTDAPNWQELPGVKNKLRKGDTALIFACRLGHVDSVRALLRAGVAVAVKNEAGETPLDVCKNNAAIERAFTSELLQHVCSGTVSRVEKLLLAGVQANVSDGSPDGAYPLHWAASFGQAAVVRLLCNAGKADVNVQNKLGATPAHEAAATGSIETLAVLLECGADLNIADSHGKKPVDVARNENVLQFINANFSNNNNNNNAKIKPTAASPGTKNGVEKKNNKEMSKEEMETLINQMRRRIDEQDALIDSLKGTLDSILRDNGVNEHVQRLHDHVGALTRNLSATAEQRDKLQNLYQASDRELEAAMRELSLLKMNNTTTNNNKANAATIKNQTEDKSSSFITHGNVANDEEDLSAKCARLMEELEREKKEAYTAARLHLTYEADLRAEIKALQEQIMSGVMNDASEEKSSGNGFFSSIIPW